MSKPEIPPASTDLPQRSHNRGLMIVILVITVIPVIAAWGIYKWSAANGGLPQSNYGELVTPPKPVPPSSLLDARGQPLPADVLSGHWSLIYLGGPTCDAACAKQVFEVRNFLALIKHTSRLRVFYLAPDEAGLEAARVAIEKFGKPPILIREAEGQPELRGFFGRPQGSMLMIDPRRDWMLTYPPGFSVEGAYRDLRHLLRYSQLG
ncbi:MAG: hypothetical protein EPN72_08360 [Nevskiaceae bacterium]|nr:MAG: hypothetical protein EPN63_04245 [Nevskiaceae bacterium]TBR73156.1 MAG: hypothetical protein EPN72_08360 [Nevskiaceae bacterium]